jgi:molybdate transport system substrate-binding protein
MIHFKMLFRGWFLPLLAFLYGLLGSGSAVASSPLIAVASNLRFAIEEIASSFHKQTGLHVRFAFGSSGNLTRQIIQGAPFEMFMSADEDYVFRIFDASKGIDRGKVYAYGRIATFAPSGSLLYKQPFPEGYVTTFDKQPGLRFAIAKPELAPYGRAAKEALVHAGLWNKVQPHLIYGENISQAAQFTLSGSTLGGIIAYSLVLTPKFTKAGDYQLIPTQWHRPLGQRMVLIKGAGEVTRKFYEFMGQKQALEIFRRNGYTISKGQD